MTDRLLPGAEYVRDIEATLPPVAPLPAPAFTLTPPPETQPGQGELFDDGPVSDYERSYGPHARRPRGKKYDQ